MKTLKLPLCFMFVLLIREIQSQSFTEIINTQSGQVQGTVINYNENTVDQYLGIPFAEPPVGELRFRKPKPVEPWMKILMADKEGAACIQYRKTPYPWYDNGCKSEDCLYLNIWVPRTRDNDNSIEKLPVMFWIYGGGFVAGSNKIRMYNGMVMAAEGNVIVVTTNYRLSSLGFFTTGTETAPGNVGIYDVLEALKWVNKNIDAFGGDPDKVTLIGQSAGAIIAGMFCLSPLTEGLFKRVIMESGSPAHFKLHNITTNLDKSQKIAEEVGCADEVITVYANPNEVVDCMREKSALNITLPVSMFKSGISLPIFPTYGDEILPLDARTALITGQFHNVSILVGTVHDEDSTELVTYNTTLFGAYGKKNPKISKKQGISLMKDIFKDIFFKDRIIQHYLGRLKNNEYDKVREQVHTAFGDFNHLCPVNYFAEIFSQFGNDAYYYFFVHRSSSTPWAKWLKVPHMEEVQFVFGKPLIHRNVYSQEEVILSSRIITIWSSFIKYGTPECPSQMLYPESNWPLYSREKPTYVTLGADIKKGIKGYGLGPHLQNCEFYRPYFEYT